MHNRPYEPMNTCTEEWMKICPVEIPIQILTASQEFTYSHPLPPGHTFSGDPYIHVVFYKGEHWISDGHHRVKEAKERGDVTIEARLKFKI